MTDAERRETRLKRLRIRCWRRGTKEMDMLLGPYADGPLAALDDAQLDAFEALLEENDQDLYAWISGAAEMNPRHAEALGRVAAHHGV
ncbi:succinate dehydrogenase assembly factor 2 [Rubrimonas cliftonensis]|uniref:FAD assembly factor SdhE n=1 Tax=Rubrimonas cliftonensis TaxID=89524 RepID=A0A1H3W0N7_9RHOB|nr:succinate dehydrogenase assembly factor 2 [Rubrimonas cliftonensis]SDZ80633.1 antitoxin CptB [Rubrimonas cliftonensis]